MKKKRLEIEYSYDFELLGIISSAKGFKLAWEINNILHIKLARQVDLQIEHRNNLVSNYGYYSYQTEVNTVRLFRNKPLETDSNRASLVQEFPHYDYILLAQGDEQVKGNRLQELLRNIPSVELVAFIPLDALKTKDTFIF